LRSLAAEYGVAHTTLGRYFARPDVARELREQARALRAEQQAARREEREVRDQAQAQAALAQARARQAAAYAQLPRRSDPRAARLDERDRRLPLLRADLRSECDRLAERAVAAGGDLQTVIEATGLRSRDNALQLVDPAILVRAFDNDAAARASLAARARLRRLVPDPELVKRRAAGEPLRELARAYEIAHTTLSRYFRRPEVLKQLQQAAQLIRAEQRAAETRQRAEQKAEQKAERDARRQAKRPLSEASPPAPRDEPEHAELPAPTALRRPASDAAVRLGRAGSHADRRDERDTRVTAKPEQRVRLVTESGKTTASTSESNAERMIAALEPHYGPLTVVPA
jgi:hypothetical protein